jgi:TPR repeat protein
LGECYRQGEGTAPDPAKALENYEKGCRGGHARSCFNAALMYRHGLGGPPDDDLAEERRRQACELGLQDACRPR